MPSPIVQHMVNFGVFGPRLRLRMLLHMSALGHKRTYAVQKSDVRFTPKANVMDIFLAGDRPICSSIARSVL